MDILLMVFVLCVLSVIIYLLQSLFFKEKDWEEKYLTSVVFSFSFAILFGLFGFKGILIGIGGLLVGSVLGQICNKVNP